MRVNERRLAELRAQRIWEKALNGIFNNVDRHTFHNQMEKISSIHLWESTLTLLDPNCVSGIGEFTVQDALILEQVREASTSVKSIQFLDSN